NAIRSVRAIIGSPPMAVQREFKVKSINNTATPAPGAGVVVIAEDKEQRLLAILLDTRGAQTGQTMLVDRVLPRQELFNRERVAGAGFLKREETAANRCDHFGLTPNDPALRSRCRQVRYSQRAPIGANHVLRPRTQGLIH